MNANAPRPSSGSEVLSGDAPEGDEDDEIGDGDRVETSGDIVSVAELDDQEQLDQVCYYFLLITKEKISLSRVQILVMKSEVIMKEVFLVVLENRKQNEYLNQQHIKERNEHNHYNNQ